MSRGANGAQADDVLGRIVPPQVSTTSTKAVSIALDEISQGRVVPVYPPSGGAVDEAGEEG